MKKLFLILFAFSFIAVSCEKGDPGPDPGPQSANRTVLVYMAADNSLSGFATKNIVSMIQGVKANDNLLVYLNYPNSNSKLIKVTPDGKGTIDINNQQVVKTYGDDSAVSVDVMNRVFNDMFTLYPAESYGLVLWSHGMGWLPASGPTPRSFSIFSILGSEASAFYGDSSQRDPDAPATKWWGEDEGAKMDITDLVSAFPAGKKFEFILFDACFMSNIETYYEMRNITKYLIGSPAEILGDGFPYKDVVPLFFEEAFSPKKVCQAFMAYYRQPANYVSYGISAPSASAAYVVTSEIDALAVAIKNINATVPEIADATSVQAYEKASSHVFYDFGDYIDKRVSAANPVLYDAFANQLKRTVPFEDHTEKLFGNVPGSGFFDVNSSSGISAYIPGNINFDAAYSKTGWALATR